MFNEPFLRRADCFKLAHQGAHISSHIDVAKLKRFLTALADDAGIVYVTLDFGVDEQGLRCASGNIVADVHVICQRCLKPMDFQVRAMVNVAFVRDDEQAQHLPKHYEPVIVDEDNCVDLFDVIEDDLLLGLPLVTYHVEVECCGLMSYETNVAVIDKVKNGVAQERTNPFNILEQLKKPRS